jgi:hypothetical protein
LYGTSSRDGGIITLVLECARAEAFFMCAVPGPDAGKTPTLAVIECSAALDAAAREFAAMVGAVNRSAAVYGRVTGEMLDLWTVLPRRDDAAEEAIAEALCKLMLGHPGLSFDFMITDQDNPSVRHMSDSGYVLVRPTSDR